MSNYPEKYMIPEDRIPKQWSQGPYGCCVAASITKVLEVINYIKTGTYTMMSKGYVYAKHNPPEKSEFGMYSDYAIEKLLEYGSVPEEMFPIMDEPPYILKKLNALPNVEELNEFAKRYKIKSYSYIRGDIYKTENIKKFLYEHNMPLVGEYKQPRNLHSVCIVGWDGDKFIVQGHDNGSLYKTKISYAWYLDGGIEDKEENMEFTDVKDDRWSKKYIEKVSEEGLMKGISDKEFAPEQPVTREQLAAVLCRTLYGME